MIVKIIPSPKNRNIGAVTYNTNKVDRNSGELMKVANFGPLQALSNLRPQDYINYLQLLVNQNKNIRKPQFHVVISAKHKIYDKSALTKIAEKWMKEMGYGSQPYLVVFHRDTNHNHVHIVSVRIDKDGKKISSAFENVHAQESIRKVLGYDFAFRYQFSTRAQFMLLLENQGYPGRDPDEQKITDCIAKHVPDRIRALEIRAIFQRFKDHPDFEALLNERYGIDLVFHSADGNKPYGYSIIDHQGKQVFKGSEVMALKEILQVTGEKAVEINEKISAKEAAEQAVAPAHIQSVWIADDVDDQQIHGMRRRRQKKARTNTR
jgi:hypothetical protein